MESNNTDEYLLVIENEDSKVTQENTTTNTSLMATLDRGQAYNWWVISSSSQSPDTERSETFRFYVEAEEQTDYIPFSANLLLPQNNSTLNLTPSRTVTFTWEGFDTDNNIMNYDLRIWTSTTANNPVTHSAINNTQTTLTLSTGTTYFWLIVTNDSQGNNSISETYTFTTN